MTNREPVSFLNVIDLKSAMLIGVAFVFMATALSIVLVELEAFESLYEFSRAHEEWELDEVILVTISLLIALAFSSLWISVVMARRILVMARQRIAHERQLTHGRKLQSMGALLGGLSHSLNNHLLPILTITRMVRNECSPEDEAYEDLSRVLQAADGARQMLRQVLNFTRQEDSDLETSCVVGEAVKTAFHLAKASTPSAVSVSADLPELPVSVPVSRLNIEIILLNLISNAVDAIESKGGKTGNIHVSMNVLSGNKAKKGVYGDSVCIKVRDDGVGLTEEQKTRIFDPFYTTKETGKGTGLGLSETYGIITSAGGRIDVNSTLGESTEIVLTLPVVTD